MIRQDFSLGWYPSVNPLHAPPNCLLIADNLVWDEMGVVELRSGSARIYSLTDQDVHSLYTATIGGIRYRFAGVGANLYSNGSILYPGFDGTGDLQMLAWLGHAFFARGTTRRKYDGTSLTNWGMRGPTIPASTVSIGAFSATLGNCDLAEVPEFTLTEGSPAGASGSSIATPGQALYGGTVYPGTTPSFQPSQAFDGSFDDTHGFSLYSGAATYIGQDFGAAKTILRVKVTTTTFLYGFNAKLQYSDDGVAWFDAGVTLNVNIGTAESVVASGSHRYWRFLDQLGFPYLEGVEIEFFTAAATNIHGDGVDGTANGSVFIKPDTSTGRAATTRLFTSDQDFLTIAGYKGNNQDVFDMAVWITNPEEVETITIMAGLTPDATDPFKEDYLYFDFRLGGPRQGTISIPDAGVARAEVAGAAVTGSGEGGSGRGEVGIHLPYPPVQLDDTPQRKKTGFLSLGDPDKSVDNVDPVDFFRRRERKDRASNPGWTHLSCLRGQFNRVGVSSGRDWDTVRGIKVIYKAAAGSLGSIRIDNLLMLGGVGTQALVGKYQIKYRFAKRMPMFMEKSPAGPASDPIDLIGNSMVVTVPRTALEAKDPQADTILFYMYGGNLGDYYKVHESGVTPLPAGIGWRFNEFPPRPDGLITAQDRLRIVTGGFTTPNGGALASTTNGGWQISEFPRRPDGNMVAQDRRRMTTGDFASPVFSPHADGSLSVSMRASEVDALILDDVLDRDLQPPPDYIVGIAGPFRDRMLLISQEPGKRGFLWLSERRQPTQYRFSRARAIGDDKETLYWVVATTGGAYIGTSVDIYVVTGTGDEALDDSFDFALHPLNNGAPPVGPEVAVEGNSLYYRAQDGWRDFGGAGSIPVPRDTVDLLYKPGNRSPSGTLSVNPAGRFRGVKYNGLFTAITPESGFTTFSTVLHRYDSRLNKWYKHTYPWHFRSIFREPDGTLIAGTATGDLLQLDTGTSDQGTPINMFATLPMDDDGLPFSRKDPMDWQVMFDSNGEAAISLALHFDQSDAAAISASAQAATKAQIFKEDLSTLGPFRQAQLRISGTTAIFRLYGWMLNYRPRPIHRMAVDTGYIQTGKQDLDWIRFVRVLMCAEGDVTLTVLFDEVAKPTKTVTAVAGKTAIYEVPLGREYSGGQPRILLSRVLGQGIMTDTGIEVYWIEIGYHPTGNETERNVVRISPEGVMR